MDLQSKISELKRNLVWMSLDCQECGLTADVALALVAVAEAALGCPAVGYAGSQALAKSLADLESALC